MRTPHPSVLGIGEDRPFEIFPAADRVVAPVHKPKFIRHLDRVAVQIPRLDGRLPADIV